LRFAFERPQSSSATVGSTTICSQGRTYDNVGNVLQLATTVPTVGGGTQTDNQSFCYDALSRLIWAGNSGTPTGGDHCGNAPAGSTVSAYQQSFSYDDLDRMASGPAGSVTYGDINHVHAATTLGSMPNPYAGYDAMGNMTCRNTDTTSGHTCGSSPTGALMSYDNEGRLTGWTAPTGTTATDAFLYDNAGNRVLQRVNNGTVTDTITFDGYTETVLSGGTTTTTKYYNVNGQRVALKTGGTLSYLLSDVLGSSTIALDSTGTTQAVQLFAPYGSIRYSQGTMPTTYNFTGQRLDSQTGLLYYNFRYYDPVSGRFVRADTTQTNAGGMDPYAYVGNNPEGRTDPTGHCWPWCTALIGAAVGAVIGVAVTTATSYATTGKPPSGGELLQAAVSGAVSGAIVGVLGPGAGVVEAIGIGALTGAAGGVAGRLAYNGVTGKSWSAGLVQAGVEGAVIGGLTGGVFKAAAPLLGKIGRTVADGLCSFTPDTPVTTDHGKRSIGKLQVGNRVLAYNPRTHNMELQPILHVWIHSDNDLVEITVVMVDHGSSHKTQVRKGELLHTTSEHPFLTTERGFLPAGQLVIGMHILRANGSTGIITGWKIVPGTKVMYNLEVANDHTFTVGAGQWVVHNRCDFASMADELAKSLRIAAFKDTHATISVAFAQDEEGNVSTLVGMNSSSRRPWRIAALERLLDGEGTIVPAPGDEFHAEQNILNYMRANNLDLLGIGASRDICLEICAPAILDFSGGNFGVIGTPIQNYVTGEVVWRPEWYR